MFLYLTFFPTVSSGPIIRYADFKSGLIKKIDVSFLNKGINRFAIGLAKKVLIADKIVIVADYYFSGVANGNYYSTIGLWIGSIAYTIQLYYDFSGYSDMAIGIGNILGFDIKENFNKPYQAKSIQDFWRRWHISLSTWFRDYIYIPLGGNRGTVGEHIRNLAVVWLLTGIWHGADWSFIAWGMGYFIVLTFEKYSKKIIPVVTLGWRGHLYSLFVINIMWVLFRSNSLFTAFNYIKGMFNWNMFFIPVEEIGIRFIPLVALAIVLCLPWDNYLTNILKRNIVYKLKEIVIWGIFFITMCAVVNSTYSPYIYGTF